MITEKLAEASKQNYKWVINGLYYGYPECCILSFCKEPSERNENQIIASNYTGFIPCKYHAKRILDGKTNLKNIIKNRICPVDFNEGKEK